MPTEPMSKRRRMAGPSMRALILSLIQERWTKWRAAQSAWILRHESREGFSTAYPMPNPTVTWVRDELVRMARTSASVPEAFKESIPQYQTTMVRVAIDTLVNQGRLGVAFGMSKLAGRRAKIYLPAPETPTGVSPHTDPFYTSPPVSILP